jgi:photosystem II stability/assembly factor-like uncharacterized protein
MRFPAARIAAVVLAGLLTAGLAVAGPSGADPLPAWTLLDTGSTSHFRGLAAVSSKVAWVGGYDGTILRTRDGGQTWLDASPAGADTLQFRDIAAFDARHAVAMAAGEGTDSRLYVTSNGGHKWRLAYQNTDPAAFFDCMSFSTPSNGLVLSDPVDGKFRILSTRDGGKSWRVLPSTGMPPALDGEFGFAASGECLTTSGHDAWFGSGGTSVSRIFHSTDRGHTWTVTDSPIVSTPSGGVFGLAFRGSGAGVAVGGDFADPTAATNVAAYSATADGPWTPAATQPGGYRSGVTFVPGSSSAIAVGLTGSDVSSDGGRHWTPFDAGQFDTVGCASDGSCWASGDLGRVAVLDQG